MVKCEICKSQIKELFLGKIKGTILKDKKGKKHTICFDCQKKFRNNKEDMIKNV